jgi:transcriptional regulator with XRE-family HTH domain
MSQNSEWTQRLGLYIMQCRKKLGLNMVEASKKLSELEDKNFSRSQWNNWELGIREPSHHIYESMAKILGTTRELLAWDFLKESSANQIDRFNERNIDRDDIIHHIAIDNSLSPQIKKDDELLIDTANKSVKNLGLFAIDANNSLWVKWIRPELTGGFTVYCTDKNNYPDRTIKNLDEINIIGSIVNINRWL